MTLGIDILVYSFPYCIMSLDRSYLVQLKEEAVHFSRRIVNCFSYSVYDI